MNTSARRTAKRDRFQPAGRWIKPWRRLAIYLRDGFRCVHCGKDLSRTLPRGITLDHVVPRSRYRYAAGGPNRTSNLITSCAKCNERRGDRTLGVFWSLVCSRKGARRGHLSLHESGYIRLVNWQARRPMGNCVELAKALLSSHPWPEAHKRARRHAKTTR